MEKLKWNPYVLMKNHECDSFWRDHLSDKKRRLLFILGKGFDFRMNMGITKILNLCPEVNITCFLIDFDEGKSSSSQKFQHLVKANFEELIKIVGEERIEIKSIELWRYTNKKKRRVGDKNVSDLFNDFSSIENYTDIIVDISALPRGIYFSLIGKLLSLIEVNTNLEKVQNFFVITAENAELDKNIFDSEPDDELSYVFGFLGGSELTSEKKPTIWLPILGEGQRRQIQAAHGKVKPEELCPVLPFPSKNPRRSDKLMIEYHQLLFDELSIESQNIIYVQEQNPFEVYRTLYYTVVNYDYSLKVLGGCDVVISAFSSKLLSIGALMVAFEFKMQPDSIKVGILNVDSSGYDINSDGYSKSLIDQTELFITWLAGEPYIK